jgi:hypothetical protein
MAAIVAIATKNRTFRCAGIGLLPLLSVLPYGLSQSGLAFFELDFFQIWHSPDERQTNTTISDFWSAR